MLIPEISISIAAEARPVRANTQPWLIIPYAFQDKEPFSSARAKFLGVRGFRGVIAAKGNCCPGIG
jgi:hypothetical protein